MIHRLTLWLTSFVVAILAETAHASPFPGSYWEIEYDLSDSTFWVDAPIIGVQTAVMGSGSLTLHQSLWDWDYDQPGLQAYARLLAFEMDVDYTLSGVVNQLRLELHGDANGFFDATTQSVTWDPDPAIGHADGFQTTGTLTCNGGSLICDFAGLPNGTPVKVDSTVDQPLGTLVYSGLLLTMTLPVASDPPSEYRIQGMRTAIQCRHGNFTPGLGERNYCVPEPASPLGVGVALLGIVLLRRG